MRLFVAIELSDDVRQAVAAEQARIRALLFEHDKSVRWIRPDHMHLTLAFIGNADDAQAAAIVAAMSQPVEIAPFAMSFGGRGVFPPRGAPRVLWLGLATSAADVAAAQQIVARRLADAHVALERRPFHPHLTLMRWRSSRRSDGRRAMAGEKGAPTPPMTVDDLVLFESRPSSSGPSYTARARARLAGLPRHPLQ